MESYRSGHFDQIRRKIDSYQHTLNLVTFMCLAGILAACGGKQEPYQIKSGDQRTIVTAISIIENLGDSEKTCVLNPNTTAKVRTVYGNRNGEDDDFAQLETNQSDCSSGWLNPRDFENASSPLQTEPALITTSN